MLAICCLNAIRAAASVPISQTTTIGETITEAYAVQTAQMRVHPYVVSCKAHISDLKCVSTDLGL